MSEGQEVLFDRIGLYHVERFWWEEGVSHKLDKILRRFLGPNPGRAWLKCGDDDWIEVREENRHQVETALSKTLDCWIEHEDDSRESFLALREDGKATIFLDAERLRACGNPTDPVEGTFYVGFEVEWSYNFDGADTVLTPHLRVTNHWPSSEGWAPPGAPDEDLHLMSGKDAADRLNDDFLFRVRSQFGQTQDEYKLFQANLDIGSEDQLATIFYFACPEVLASDPEDYLRGEYFEALNAMSGRVLLSEDLRSTEITGGLLEAGLATFAHFPSVAREYCLMVPVAGHEQAAIEEKISFITYTWQDLDFDATWKIRGINKKLEEEEEFYPVWKGSLERTNSLCEDLFPLLAKKGIQKRMFDLAHLLGGFLAKLQSRAAAGALRHIQAKQDLDQAIRNAKDWAERKFTLRGMRGTEPLRNVAEGLSRAFLNSRLRIALSAEDAEALTARIEGTSRTLNHMAGLEEQRRRRTREQAEKKEEQASQLLNRVLALVAVLAAIPLIFGSYDTEALAWIVSWIPFDPDLPDRFWSFGLVFSSLAALIAFFATLWALTQTLRTKRDEEEEAGSTVRTADALSDAVFDSFRGYGSDEVKTAIFGRIQRESWFSGQTWEEAEAPCKEARAFIHEVDVTAARAVARALDQCQLWRGGSGIPADDEAWAQQMEKEVCRFVLQSDVFDLRPSNLHLPATLSTYMFRFADGGLGWAPVTNTEFNRVFRSFGYSEKEIETIGALGRDVAECAKTATQFVEAMIELGVSAKHEVRFATEAEES